MSEKLDLLLDKERLSDIARNDAAMHRAVVPFSTGKVEIGILFQPKPPRLTEDQEKVQAALLDRRTTFPQSVFQRLLGRVWQWV